MIQFLKEFEDEVQMVYGLKHDLDRKSSFLKAVLEKPNKTMQDAKEQSDVKNSLKQKFGGDLDLEFYPVKRQFSAWGGR